VAGNLPTDHTFTGQIEDDSTGLQYFNARYYSGSLGRFISADTIVPGAGNPQAFNRYSYSLSNPLKYIDPSGHCAELITFAICAGVVGVVVIAGLVAADILLTPKVDTPRDLPPTSKEMTDWYVDRLKTNPESPAAQGIRENLSSGNPIKMAGAVKAWVAIVQDRGIWDYKKDIIENNLKGDVSVGGQEINFQFIANSHFGYMGRVVGMPDWFTQLGAGVAQIMAHWDEPREIGPANTWFDGPFDNWSIRFGMFLYDKYGQSPDDLTSDTFAQALQEYIETNGEPP